MNAIIRPVEKAFPVKDIACRGSAYNVPSKTVDGNDVLSVKKAVSKAVKNARNGKGPTLIECKTYRHFGHSRNDPRVYRTKDEEKNWLKKDPIVIFKEYLLKNKVATEKEIEKIEKNVEKEIEEAVDFADSCSYPDPDDVEKYVFCNE